MSDLHFLGWIRGLKTMYYSRAPKAQKTYLDNVETNQPLNHVKINLDIEECLSCHA